MKCVSQGDFNEFLIEDNGNGIEEEYHQKIFHLFQTLESNQENASTGIGLSIVKNIIEEMGGSISVESQLNKGSTFKFHWPLKQTANLDKTKA